MVRQDGSSDADDLLKQITGPAALWHVSLAGTQLLGISGTTQASEGERRYLGFDNKLQLGASEIHFGYTGDDRNGTAAEALVSHAFGPLKISLSQTLNWGFESAWTGSGPTQAAHMTESWASGAVGSMPLGLGLRETTRRDGKRATELRSFQMTTVTGITLMNTTSTALTQGGSGSSSGSLMAMSSWRSLYSFGEVDYGGTRFGATAARLSLGFPAGRSWNLYADADQPLAGGRPSLDIGATRSIGAFLVGPFAGADMRSATIGLRLWLPLSADERSTSWFGPYYRDQKIAR